jgi:predicted dehydrogenase
MTAGENPAYPFFPNQDCYHFAGSVGSLDFPSMQTRTYRGEPDRSWWLAFTEGRRSLARRDPLATQIDHFVDVIRGQAAPRVSARDGMLNMVVLEAIVRSAELGRDVAIAEIAA